MAAVMSSSRIFIGIFPLLVCIAWFSVPGAAFVPKCMTENCTDADLCPVHCKCQSPPQNITDCSGQAMEAPPEEAEINSYTRILRLDSNKIDTLWKMDFPVLKEMFMQNNGLNHIKDDAFSKCKSLTFLNLSHNQLEFVSDRALQYLNSLISLDLSYNNIAKLTKRNFNGNDLRKLTVLDLSHNAITTIQNEAFYRFKSLLRLKLSFNRLKSISETTFGVIASVNTLLLDHNKINHIADRSFSRITNLTHLALNSNELADLKPQSFNNTRLDVLNLGYNLFGKVPAESLRELHTMVTLILDGNQFEKIEKDDFPINLTHTTHLSLSELMVLKDIHANAFDDLPKLIAVNISGNPALTSLPETLFFRSFHRLRDVDISGNGLTHVDVGLLPWNHLYHVKVSGNNWLCDCNAAWMKHYRFHKDIKCSSPSTVAGKMYSSLELDQLCPGTTIDDDRQAVRNGLAATALVLSIVIVGFFLYRFRRQLPCVKKPGSYNTLYNIYDPTKENSNNVVIRYQGEQADSKTTGVDMNNEMKGIL